MIFLISLNIELRNANIQSKHRLMSKLSEQLLFKAFNSSSSITFTEKELNAIRPVVHYFKDNDSDQLNNAGSSEVHQKFNKLNHNLTKLLKSRNLFEVANNPAVIHVIRGVWALGFTLAKLIQSVCVTTSQPSSIDRKRNCVARLQQVLDSDKQFVRNITVNLNEKVNIRMNNQLNATFEEDKLQFDKNLQLTTIHYTINKLNNSQLIKIAYYADCCGLRNVHQNLDSTNFDLLNHSLQPMLFNNAYSILSSSNHYQINRPTQSTPSFGTRLSTRKTIFINPIKQTSTTVTIDNNNETEAVDHSLTQPETTTDITRSTDRIRQVQLNELTTSNIKITDNLDSNSKTTSLISSDSIEDTTNKEMESTTASSSTTLGTTMNTIEVIRISAEPELNDILDKKLMLSPHNFTKLTSSESLNKRINQFNYQPSNQTRYIRKPIKKTTVQDNLAYLSNRRKGTTRPYIKEQVLIKNGKIVLNNTVTSSSSNHKNLSDTTKATIASVTSDRHSSNQFKKDNEAEIERRFSIVVLFLSIGEYSFSSFLSFCVRLN